jgi:putative ABC transport system permease protein
MILLRLISWPYFRKHVLRTVLTTAGIVLGVAVFVGMHTANRSVLSAFSDTVDRIAGKTELEVTAGETGFGEDVLETVQAAATVRAAAPVIEAIVDSNVKGQGSLLVLAIDMTGDRTLRDYDLESSDTAVIDDPLVFLAQPDSLMLSKDFAGRNNIQVGSQLRLGTVLGEKLFTVRGIMKPSGLAGAFGGNLAIMDIYAAQRMFGRGRTFDRIDVGVKPGVTLAECQRELRQLLGPGFEVQPPSGRGHQFEAMLSAYSMMVTLSSAFALFIGMFIIYNAFAIAVTQRRSEIGILRALGATRTQIRSVFLGESALMGLVGSALGLVFGVVIARAIAASIGALLTNFYRTAQRVEEVATNPWLLAGALLLGVVSSVVAAAIPARNAARMDPVQALQKGKYHVLTSRESRVRLVSALVLAGVAVACSMITGSRPVFYAGYLSLIAGTLLLGPLLSLAVARAIRPALRWLWPVEGALAADSLIQSPRRTSGSVIALMLAIALVVAFEGMGRANYNSIVDWADDVLNPDLFVVPSQSLDIKAARFPAAMVPEIVAIPGVERVQTLRNARIPFRKTPTMIVAFDMLSMKETVRRPPVVGDRDEMYRKASAGEGLLVSDSLAELQHLSLGDPIEISAPYGQIRLPIVGIIVDYSDQQGSIIMDRALFNRYWRDDSANMFRVYVKDGVDAASVRQRILDRYAGARQVFVLTNGELKTYIVGLIGEWFGLTTVQIAIAVLVAILGIVNTLTVSITDRRRELGVLKAVGAVGGQIRHTIWIEAVSVAAIGLILGFALGAINLFYVLEVVHRDVAGLRLNYDYPVTVALVLVPIMFFAAFAAALWPAESAVRGSLVEALEYE